MHRRMNQRPIQKPRPTRLLPPHISRNTPCCGVCVPFPTSASLACRAPSSGRWGWLGERLKPPRRRDQCERDGEHDKRDDVGRDLHGV